MSEEESRMVVENALMHGDPWVIEAYQEILDERKAKRLQEANQDEYYQVIEKVERDMITKALRDANGLVGEAAKTLGIKRPTLSEKMRRFGISAKTVFIDEDGYAIEMP